MMEYTDDELIQYMEDAVAHFTNVLDSHLNYIGNEQKIFEIYYDRALDRVLESLDIDEDDVERMCERINSIF